MAKLGVYYGLCPLIDQKSLLGVSEDETEGFIIVTLGKNMAIKYKLSDQKQIHSWSTKDHLTSRIVYDKGFNQYVAVFDNNSIRIFGSDCENLDKIKKYKFQIQLLTLITTQTGETLVLFKNGTVSSLKHAIDNRKANLHDAILDDNDVIESYDSFCFEDRITVSLLVKNDKDECKFVIMNLTEDKVEDINNITTMNFKKSSTSLTGHVLINKDDALCLLTLWSDGKLHAMPLKSNEEFPGPLLSIVDSLRCKEQVCMLALSSTYIALYGSDKHEEGASLVIYNIQFKVTQCKQPFKLYSVGSKLYLIRNNMLLTVGNHLAVLPYQLATEQLAALIGSHRRVDHDDISILTEVVDWGEVSNGCNENNIPTSLRKYVETYHNEGLPERLICSEVIPKLIENKNIDNLLDVLNYFTEVPEPLIVDLIVFVLTAGKHLFKSDQLLEIENSPIQPLKRSQLLNSVLFLSYNDVLIMPYLRSKLQIAHSLTLLNYICTLLGSYTWVDESQQIESESKLIEWGSLLLDAQYQKFLLSKDDEIAKVFKLFYSLVDTRICCINEYKPTITMLDLIKRGKSYNQSRQIVSKWYSVEKMTLY